MIEGESHRGKCKYEEDFATFDIESTSFPDHKIAVMYLWQFYYKAEYKTGRTWKEFINLIKSIDTPNRLVIFVHNLSYEFQFFRRFFNWDEVMIVKSRTILKAVTGNIEFRCSYLLTNRSLDSFLKVMQVEHKKLSGEKFDYKKRRLWNTPLTEYEQEYAKMDVVGLYEGIKKKLVLNGDTIATMPLTSTGYVRRDIKRAIARKRYYLARIMPKGDLYQTLRNGFRGGNTHANRFVAEQVIEGVKACDRASSYPAEAALAKYPYKLIPDNRDIDTIIYKLHRACIFEIKMTNIYLKEDTWPVPYISLSKCTGVRGAVLDNGRILSADELTTTITDIDYKILKEEYHFEIESISHVYSGIYKELPKELTDLVLHYFEQKTKLKYGDPIEYAKFKELLNAIYGCCAQDPGKESIEYVNGDYEIVDKSIDERLEESRPVLPYQWGVWITAHAREELEKMIRIAHEQGLFVYADTDSCYYCGDIDIASYNNAQISKAEAHKAMAYDVKGKVHYLGVFEEEGEYDKFITMGAKKYCTEKDGEIKLTVAGVNKEKGAEELGTIDNFRKGFVFKKAGGTTSYYDDGDIRIVEIDGTKCITGASICITDSTYKLGLSKDYASLLATTKLTGREWQYA
mgnify:FL=1